MVPSFSLPSISLITDRGWNSYLTSGSELKSSLMIYIQHFKYTRRLFFPFSVYTTCLDLLHVYSYMKHTALKRRINHRRKNTKKKFFLKKINKRERSGYGTLKWNSIEVCTSRSTTMYVHISHGVLLYWNNTQKIETEKKILLT